MAKPTMHIKSRQITELSDIKVVDIIFQSDQNSDNIIQIVYKFKRSSETMMRSFDKFVSFFTDDKHFSMVLETAEYKPEESEND